MKDIPLSAFVAVGIVIAFFIWPEFYAWWILVFSVLFMIGVVGEMVVGVRDYWRTREERRQRRVIERAKPGYPWRILARICGWVGGIAALAALCMISRSGEMYPDGHITVSGWIVFIGTVLMARIAWHCCKRCNSEADTVDWRHRENARWERDVPHPQP